VNVFVVVWALLWWEAVEAAFAHEQRAAFTQRPLRCEGQWLETSTQLAGIKT
jgi:hypothetical protein